MARAASFLQPAHLQLLQRHCEPDQTLSPRLASLNSLHQPSSSFDLSSCELDKTDQSLQLAILQSSERSLRERGS